MKIYNLLRLDSAFNFMKQIFKKIAKVSNIFFFDLTKINVYIVFGLFKITEKTPLKLKKELKIVRVIL